MRIVGGRLSGRRFGSPSSRGTRPTSERVREGIASALEARGAFEQAKVLDLFSGTGALAFEALSRGGKSAVLVDRDARCLRESRQSAHELELDSQVKTVQVDLSRDFARVVGRLGSPPDGFGLVFVDAPYDTIEQIPRLLQALAKGGIFNAGAWVVVEHPVSHAWGWPEGLASVGDYRYGGTAMSLATYAPEEDAS